MDDTVQSGYAIVFLRVSHERHDSRTCVKLDRRSVFLVCNYSQMQLLRIVEGEGVCTCRVAQSWTLVHFLDPIQPDPRCMSVFRPTSNPIHQTPSSGENNFTCIQKSVQHFEPMHALSDVNNKLVIKAAAH